MSLFNSDAEKQRKENLKNLEDRRLRLAEAFDQQGFRPEHMLLCSREDGSFAAMARHEGRFVLIDSPKFGEDGEFNVITRDEAPAYERQDIFEKGTGLNGAFGFGTKGASGFILHLDMGDGIPVLLPVISGRTSWMEVPYKKNPLLSKKRRRGNANVMWDFTPIYANDVEKIERLLLDFYLK